MPLYEYHCECGRQFDRVKPIDRRHDVLCEWGRHPQLKMSRVFKRMGVPFAVFAHDGTLLHETQTTEKTPPPGYRYENPNLVEV